MIFDYLKWRGDLSFNQSSFNKIDALILSRAVYIPFENIIEEEITLKEALENFLNSENNMKNVIMENDIELAKSLLNSARFYKLKISNYINNIDLDIEKQFSALTVRLNNQTKIVVFRGTDSTVVGWKEDFNMSFEEHVPAQLEAIEYLKNVMDEDNCNVIIVGHSKGGNLSVYSAIFIDDEYKEKILKIYNFDGPGFNDKIVNDCRYEKVLNKINTFIPQDAIVGTLLERKEIPKIVLSNEKYLMQHDLYSWNIERNDFVYTDNLSKESKFVNENIKLWLNNISVEERKTFIDTLYTTISTINLDMKEIVTDWQQSISLIIKTIQDPVFRDMLQKSVKIFLDSAIKSNKNK